MDTYNIKSYSGFEYASFNETRESIRKRNLTYVISMKSDYENHTSDMYNNFFIYYDLDDCCEAVEFFGNCEVYFENIGLLNKNYIEVYEAIKKLDDDICQDDNGFISNKFGFGVYVSSLENIHAPIESVLMFKKGYFDNN